MIAVRVGIEIRALLASSLRLQPRPAQVKPTFSGSSTSKRPPDVTFTSEMISLRPSTAAYSCEGFIDFPLLKASDVGTVLP